MQNNALVRIFGILFAIVSIYQLSFTFITSQQEQKAAAYAAQQILDSTPNYLEERELVALNYLDSIGGTSLYGFTSYNDAKGKELNKGLDLKGGINVILQISIKDILKGLAENSKNPIFNQALENADKLQKESDVP
ncbi:MAG: protein translocase subunit SecDF, partial [Flavobacteriaceae bacterium]